MWTNYKNFILMSYKRFLSIHYFWINLFIEKFLKNVKMMIFQRYFLFTQKSRFYCKSSFQFIIKKLHHQVHLFVEAEKFISKTSDNSQQSSIKSCNLAKRTLERVHFIHNLSSILSANKKEWFEKTFEKS